MFRFCANTLTRVTANRGNHDQILKLSKLFGSVRSSRSANVYLCVFVCSVQVFSSALNLKAFVSALFQLFWLFLGVLSKL